MVPGIGFEKPISTFWWGFLCLSRLVEDCFEITSKRMCLSVHQRQAIRIYTLLISSTIDLMTCPRAQSLWTMTWQSDNAKRCYPSKASMAPKASFQERSCMSLLCHLSGHLTSRSLKIHQTFDAKTFGKHQLTCMDCEHLGIKLLWLPKPCARFCVAILKPFASTDSDPAVSSLLGVSICSKLKPKTIHCTVCNWPARHPAKEFPGDKQPLPRWRSTLDQRSINAFGLSGCFELPAGQAKVGVRERHRGSVHSKNPSATVW